MAGRAVRGSRNYHAGMAAEDCAARHYQSSGCTVLERRWRGKGGELDLIVCGGDATVFVEVKRAETHAEAAARIGDRQIGRLRDVAAEYMATLPDGMLSDVRFDIALVDAMGRVDVLENALH